MLKFQFLAFSYDARSFSLESWLFEGSECNENTRLSRGIGKWQVSKNYHICKIHNNRMHFPNACDFSPYFLRTKLDENYSCHLKRISYSHTFLRAFNQNCHHNHRFRQNLKLCPKGPSATKTAGECFAPWHKIIKFGKFTIQSHALS